MPYEYFRYARRVDADVLDIKHADGTRLLRFDKATANTIKDFGGGGVTGDDRILFANIIDTYPQLHLDGNAGLWLTGKTEVVIAIESGRALTITKAGAITTLAGSYATANDLILKANSTDAPNITITGTGDISLTPAGVVKFGTKTGTGDTATDGYISIKDAAGNAVKLATVA